MRKTISEKAREIEVIKEVDVLIVGGGTAGSVATIASARQGVKTLVVESFGFLGGSVSAGLVTPMMQNHINEEPLNKGIGEEINERLLKEECSGRIYASPTKADVSYWINPELNKYVLEDMCLESGAEILYYTNFSEPIIDKNKIVGIIVENKLGRKAIIAKRVIDATGDADVAFRAGVPCESGRLKDGLNQAMSVRFIMGNVNLKKLSEFLTSIDPENKFEINYPLVHAAFTSGDDWPLNEIAKKAIKDGILEEEDEDYFQLFSIPGREGEITFNCPRISNRVKGTDPFDLTNAQIVGKKKIRRLIKFCKKYLPGFENAHLVLTAPMVGIRESRRIVGEYVLTVDDIKNHRKFEDGIARNNYPIDIHNPKRDDNQSVTFEEISKKDYHEIPYRCLVPKMIDNLLVAGRCISATFEAQSSIRIQPTCRAFGEAAGLASALSIRENISPRNFEGKRLKQIIFGVT